MVNPKTIRSFLDRFLVVILKLLKNITLRELFLHFYYGIR